MHPLPPKIYKLTYTEGVGKFFSGVFAKLNGEEEEQPIEIEEPDEDDFGFSMLSADADKLPKKVKRTFVRLCLLT